MPDLSVVRRGWRVPALALSLLLAVPAAASAAPLSAARGLTVFTAGNATVTSNENDGSMALGGNLVLPSGGDYRVGNNTVSPYRIDNKPFALYVGGTVQFNGGRLTVNGNNYARVVNGSGLTGTTSGGTASIKRAGSSRLDRAQHGPAVGDHVRRARRTRSISRPPSRRCAPRRTPTARSPRRSRRPTPTAAG